MIKNDRSIEIIINGFKETVPEGASISQLILDYDEMDSSMIVERNGRFVYPRDYATTQVDPGDVLEFIHPDFGG
jgi:sulfur carrier protein